MSLLYGKDELKGYCYGKLKVLLVLYNFIINNMQQNIIRETQHHF